MKGKYKGFVFSLDAFFSLLVMVMIIAILLYAQTIPTHHYKIAYEAKALASDALHIILPKYNGDIEGWETDSCRTLDMVFSRLPYKYALVVGPSGGNQEVVCGDTQFESNVGIVGQSAEAFLIGASNRQIPGNPFFYKSCNGQNTPCDAIDPTVNLGTIDVIVVRLVVFI